MPDLTSDLWTGFLIGASVGSMAGILWREAYDLIRAAIKEKRRLSSNNDDPRKASDD